jgi:hypothetical protein
VARQRPEARPRLGARRGRDRPARGNRRPAAPRSRRRAELAARVAPRRAAATHDAAHGRRNAPRSSTRCGWGGSYHRVDPSNNTVDPGVAIWESFKDEAEKIALERLAGPVDATKHLGGKTGTSHEFDISNGEAFALRTLTPGGYRQAAEATFAAMAKRFGTDDVARWREPRRMYEVTAQGAAKPPEIPFFDRGTWEQLVELAPSG